MVPIQEVVELDGQRGPQRSRRTAPCNRHGRPASTMEVWKQTRSTGWTSPAETWSTLGIRSFKDTRRDTGRTWSDTAGGELVADQGTLAKAAKDGRESQFGFRFPMRPRHSAIL